MTARVLRFPAAAALTLLASCAVDSSGGEPPEGQFHYPVAAVATADARTLLVLNSDFNLAYRGGRVLSLDLGRIRACAAARGTGSDPACAQPAPSDGEAAFVQSSVEVGPFATALRLARNDGRVYVTIRGDGSLTYADLAQGRLSCRRPSDPSAPGDERCTPYFRRGQPPLAYRGVPDDQMPPPSPRGLVAPPLPTNLDAADDGFIAVTHQESPRARMSLFFDDGVRGPVLAHTAEDLSPNLQFALRADNLSDPAASRFPYWLVFSRAEPVLSGVRAYPDGLASYAYRADPVALRGIASDAGVRFVTRDPCNPSILYATVRAAPASGTSARASDALVQIDLSDLRAPTVVNLMPLPLGVASVAVTRLGSACTAADHTLAYVSSYDARRLYAVDTTEWRELGQIRTRAGPQSIVIDPQAGTAGHGYLYLVDFASMVVEVVDIDPASPTRHSTVFVVGDEQPLNQSL